MAETNRTTVYYNSACPVCDAGIRDQKGRMGECGVEWVDIHRAPEAARSLGTTVETIRERLHVQGLDGRVLIGAEAVAHLLDRTPGRRWIGWLLRRPGLRRLAAFAYDRFARALYRWNLRADIGRSPRRNAPMRIRPSSPNSARWRTAGGTRTPNSGRCTA